MMNQEEINYINKLLLKSGERLDFSHQIIDSDPLVDIKIVKQTERTYRVVGIFTLAIYEEALHVDEDLLKLAFTPKKKIHLNEHNQNTITWFNQGLIIKEIRFKKDGKTPDAQHFRMGFRLFQYQQEQIRAKELEIEQEFSSWKESLSTLVDENIQVFSSQRQWGYKSCLSILNEVCRYNGSDLKDLSHFPRGWSVSKRLKFLHFISAFLQLCIQKDNFDWKEIGARYYQEIGGSKEFDRFKDEFINQLEEWAQCPAALLGLTSLGKITPLYFSGTIMGRFSTYRHGPVHSLTDLSISEEEYTTSSTTIWLVENRAILTRLAAEKHFLEEMKTLVLCIDGHIRSSHKKCIKQLLTNGNVKQVLIWCDYDPDGLLISKEAYGTVSAVYQGLIKWITHSKEVLHDWKEYEQYLQDLLVYKRIEQEQVLGGVDDWRKWISR
ncbi:DUF2399 domain-containing protein [Bacillaceae bacterium C204]|uniref:Toprim sub domain-containing protein n=1 Tax=Neobacillus sp. 204 TaxID=3383351 RepID=UPI0039789667